MAFALAEYLQGGIVSYCFGMKKEKKARFRTFLSFFITMEYNPQSLLYLLFSLLSEIREIHCIPYLVHFSEDRVIKNSGIMLGHFDTGMTKHFRHVFKAHSL